MCAQKHFSGVAEGDKVNSTRSEMSRANETEAFVENKNLLAESEQQIYANVDAQFVRHFQRRIALSIRRRVLLTRVRVTRCY